MSGPNLEICPDHRPSGYRASHGFALCRLVDLLLRGRVLGGRYEDTKYFC